MISEVFQKDTEYLFDTPILHQTAYWSDVKKNMGYQTLALDYKLPQDETNDAVAASASVLSDLLVILQPIDSKHTYAYVPYGPELEPLAENQGAFLEELSESLRPYLPVSCIMIRYDLLWESPWATEESFFDERGAWLGTPDSRIQEMRLNYNTVNWNLRKAPSNILPSNTIFLNLKKQTDQLLGAMKPKTRYNIRLSARKGVQVRTAGVDEIEIWNKLYQETARRNGIFLNDIDYFKTVLSTHPDNDSVKVKLLIAEFNGIPLAAMFLVMSGRRCSYLYGASSSEHRNLMPTYALQWYAIKMAQKHGCTEYDMFGVSPGADPAHPMNGLYQFKKGFGGDVFHALGCWDYPLLADEYVQLTACEMQRQGFHIN
ncbi:MAG TPA: peptidoglycan bridge formation glycyltransferase FemA/FemB family protein [Bacteroidales bacterium]|nr:peptidoglycan bridge formation glycyltransferase FemA/FemB family protein [Bacteroidales bacterium]